MARLQSATPTRSTYRGKHLYGVHDVRNGIKRHKEEWEVIDAPVIIPEAEWLEVQATSHAVDGTSRPRASPAPPYLPASQNAVIPNAGMR